MTPFKDAEIKELKRQIEAVKADRNYWINRCAELKHKLREIIKG